MPDASNAPKFWQNIREGRYSITEVVRERWDPKPLLRCRSKSSRQNLFKNRRLGARLGVGSAEVEDAHSSTSQSGDGPHSEMGRGHRPRSFERLRVPRASVKSGAYCGHFGQRHVRRYASLFGYQNPFSGNCRRTCQCFQFRHLASAGAPGDYGTAPRGCSAEDSSDHRRHDARRTGQHHCRTHRRPL